MQGLMMDMPLQISQLIRHADRHHGAVEIVSKTVDGGTIHRYTYREAHAARGGSWPTRSSAWACSRRIASPRSPGTASATSRSTTRWRAAAR